MEEGTGTEQDFASMLVAQLDDESLLELMGGYDNDIDKLLQGVVTE